MANLFDAIAQVYEYLSVPDVLVLLSGRIYQGSFPTEGEDIGEGANEFICINTIEPKYNQLTREVPVNIQVFVKQKPYGLMDIDALDSLEEAIDTALELKEGSAVTGYGEVEKVFAHVLPENPYNKNYTLMLIRLNLIINTK